MNRLEESLRDIFMVDVHGTCRLSDDTTPNDFDNFFHRSQWALVNLSHDIFQNRGDDELTFLQRVLGGAAGVAMLPRPEAEPGIGSGLRALAASAQPGKLFKKAGPWGWGKGATHKSQNAEAFIRQQAGRPLEEQPPVRPVKMHKREAYAASRVYAFFHSAQDGLPQWACCQISFSIDNIEALLLSADPASFLKFKASLPARMPAPSAVICEVPDFPQHVRSEPTQSEDHAPMDEIQPLPPPQADIQPVSRRVTKPLPRIDEHVGFSEDHLAIATHQSLMDQASEQHNRRAMGCPREAEFSAMAKASGASSSASDSFYPSIDFSRAEVGIQAPAAPAPVIAPVERSQRSPSPPPLISVEQPAAAPAVQQRVMPPAPVATEIHIQIPAFSPLQRLDGAPHPEALLGAVVVPKAVRRAARSVRATPWRVDAHLPPVPPADAFKDSAYAKETLAGQTLALRAWVQTDAEIGAAAEALKVTIRLADGRGQPKLFTPEGASLRHVDVRLESGHYVALLFLDGHATKIDVVSQGDCFYGAVAIGSNYRRFNEVAECHLRGDMATMRGIAAAEYPGHGLCSDRELFANYTNAIILELRQRVAYTLAQKTPVGGDVEMDLVMQALAAGDLDDIKAKMKASADMARSYFGSSPFASFKNAAEGMVHACYLLETFYKEQGSNAHDVQARQEIVGLGQGFYHALQNQHHQVTTRQLTQTFDDISTLYPGRALPGVLHNFFK